jgi:hypothetical protein
MGKGAPLRWLENRYPRRHLRGRGMEIGALWRRFPVRSGARVWCIDRARPEDLKRQYPDVSEKIFLPDLVAEARRWLPEARCCLRCPINATHLTRGARERRWLDCLRSTSVPSCFDWRGRYADWVENVAGRQA